jgi:hypothetical protein
MNHNNSLAPDGIWVICHGSKLGNKGEMEVEAEAEVEIEIEIEVEVEVEIEDLC